MTAFKFWQVIANTPWWVYLLFVCLLYIGVAATKPRIISYQQFRTLPVIFLILSVMNLSMIGFSLLHLSYWFGGLIVGAAMGWVNTQFFSKMRALPNEQKLYLPGSWFVLAFIFFIFIAKYFYNYQIAISPTLLQDELFIKKIFVTYGFLMGLTAMRLIQARLILKNGPFYTPSAA